VTVAGPEGRPMTQKFRAVTIWRKEADGAWRNSVDINNAPPAERPASSSTLGG
jgi:ketosteroid isomerase-like protein